MAESFRVTGLLFTAYSIGQHHLMVSGLKLLGTTTDGGSLMVTLSNFHILSGCWFFCCMSGQQAHTSDHLSFFKLGMMDCQ